MKIEQGEKIYLSAMSNISRKARVFLFFYDKKNPILYTFHLF